MFDDAESRAREVQDVVPRVSVIIPTHNRREVLPRAVESVLAQTVSAVEVIVVDDGSTDGTADVVRSLESTAGVKGVYLGKSRGGNAARNAGLNLAGGDLIAFLDDDDVWMPEKLELQLLVFDRVPNVSLVGAWFLRDGNVQKLPPEIPVRMLLGGNFVGSFSFCLFRRNDLEAVGGLDESLSNSQDWDLWLRLVERGSVRIVQKCLVHYATHRRDRVTESADRGEYYRHFLKVVRRHEHKMSALTRYRHRQLARLETTPNDQPILRAGRSASFWIAHGMERICQKMS